jgi:NAD(P)H-dependent flavin oxidoreductase YrpB (nitropropane dioxygenase family)
MSVEVRTTDGIAEVIIDFPPVNALPARLAGAGGRGHRGGRGPRDQDRDPRRLLTSDSPVADAVKRVYLAAGLDGTVVTTRVDGVPHRVLRTTMVDQLERAGRDAGLLRAGRVGWLLRSARNAAAFRGLSGMSWPEMVRQGRALRRGTGRRDTGMSWAQVLMAANTPVLLRAAMVDGRPDLGLMSSGQVAGLIEDLPSCAELIEAIMTGAEACLDRMATIRSG